MEASIREPNIKNFVRLLQCAAKFGDDLCMHANRDIWELAVTNSSKSAFCLFTLHKAFFDRYKPIGSVAQTHRGVKCQLLVKSVLNVLGKASSVNAVERLDLSVIDPEERLSRVTHSDDDDPENEYDDPEDDLHTGFGARLEIKLLYKHGIIKKHLLHLGASEFFRADVDPESTPSGLTIDARALRDWLDHFSLAAPSTSNSGNGGGSGGGGAGGKNENQLGWMFSTTEVRVKSWEGSTSALSTEIKMNKDEFDNYEVAHETGRVDLTLPMKEFKATLQLAEQLGMTLDISFSEGSQPLTITSRFVEEDGPCEIDQFSIFCAIATTQCDAFRQPATTMTATTTTAATSRVAQISNRRPKANPSSSLKNPVGQAVTEDQKMKAQSITDHNDSVRGNDRKRRGSQIPTNSNKNPSRSRLSMSVDRDNSISLTSAPAAIYHMSQGAGPSSNGTVNIPLFDEGPVPGPSQRIMSSQQAMNISGMGDMDPQELMNAMDDAGVEAGDENGEDLQAPYEYEYLDMNMGSFNPPPVRSLQPITQSQRNGNESLETIRNGVTTSRAQPVSNSVNQRGRETDFGVVNQIPSARDPSKSRDLQNQFEIDPEIFGVDGRNGSDSSARWPLKEIDVGDQSEADVGGYLEEIGDDEETFPQTQRAGTQFQTLFNDD